MNHAHVAQVRNTSCAMADFPESGTLLMHFFRHICVSDICSTTCFRRCSIICILAGVLQNVHFWLILKGVPRSMSGRTRVLFIRDIMQDSLHINLKLLEC